MIFTPYNELIQSIPNTDLADDASESSTFSIGFATTPKIRRTHPRVKKSVAFDESKNVTYETESTKDECSDRWYTAYDIQGFRSLNGFALKKLQRESILGDDLMSTKAVLEHTYSACQGMLFDDIEVLCPVETAQLCNALRDPLFPTGLASYSSPLIRRDVRARRSKVVEIVKLIQRTVRGANKDATAEYIRMSVETISRPSRIFAQLIAQNEEACL